ncbi:MAG: hypothetical protein H6937_04270 [Burkholderiales bacterium]|nr:hypothetical protein [Burkholderiales bacterium]MDR4516133.1 hypothetical protein [Nitrosomonas sp.]
MQILFIFFIGYLYSIHTCKKISVFTLTEWQQIAIISYGGIGITLGFLYFVLKIIIDTENAKKDRIRNRLLYIHEELIQTDKLIEQILNFQINDENELKKIRFEINKKFSLLINNYIENNDKLIGFTNEELDSIIAVHSFVDKSKIISNEELNSLKESNVSAERLDYLDVFLEATTMCMQKLENL